MGGRCDRNEQSFSMTAYEDRVYCACGEDPEHGKGPGHIWCIDATKRGDVSGELAVDRPASNGRSRRSAPAVPAGEVIDANRNSAAVWHTGSISTAMASSPPRDHAPQPSGAAIKDGFSAADISGMCIASTRARCNCSGRTICSRPAGARR